MTRDNGAAGERVAFIPDLGELANLQNPYVVSSGNAAGGGARPAPGAANR